MLAAAHRRDVTPLIGLLAAGLWPLTAYVAGPLAAPLIVAAAVTFVFVVRKPERLIALAVILAPLSGISFAETDLGSVLPAQSIEPLVFLLILGALAIALVKAQQGGALQGMPWALPASFCAFAAVTVISALQGFDSEASLSPVARVLEAGALLIAVPIVCRTRRQLLVVVAGALGALLVAGAQGVFGSALGGESAYGFATGNTVVDRVQGSFDHPNKYGLFLAILIPLAATVVTAREMRPAMRWLAASALAVGVPALVMSYSRGAIAGLVGGSFVWLLFARPRLALRLGAIALVALLAFAPSSLRDRFSEDSAASDFSDRSALWESAVDIYTQRPVLGVGVGSFPDAYARLAVEEEGAATRGLLNQGDGETLPFHAHNAFLTVLAEQGLLGVLALLAFGGASVATAYRGTRMRDPACRAVCLGVGAGLLVWGSDNLFNVSLYEETILPLIALVAVAGSFVAIGRRETDPQGPPGTVSS